MRTSDDVSAESTVRLSQSRLASRRALRRAKIWLVFQWALIVWLIWSRKGC